MNEAAQPASRWLIVFALGYLALLVDGADVMMYGLTLTRIKSEFGLTNVEAGALGSLTLVGMAVGGILGGWASDSLGRVRVVVWALALFSLGAGLLGLTHSFLQFAVVRFISSLGIGCIRKRRWVRPLVLVSTTSFKAGSVTPAGTSRCSRRHRSMNVSLSLESMIRPRSMKVI